MYGPKCCVSVQRAVQVIAEVTSEVVGDRVAQGIREGESLNTIDVARGFQEGIFGLGREKRPLGLIELANLCCFSCVVEDIHKEAVVLGPIMPGGLQCILDGGADLERRSDFAIAYEVLQPGEIELVDRVGGGWPEAIGQIGVVPINGDENTVPKTGWNSRHQCESECVGGAIEIEGVVNRLLPKYEDDQCCKP